MNILLDTDLFLWSLDEIEKIPAGVIETLQNRRHEILFSAVSIWEAAAKVALGRADFALGPEDLIDKAVELGYRELPLSAAAAAALARLPPHHGDPFDRLLVAQAIATPVRLYTANNRLAPYTELVTLIR